MRQVLLPTGDVVGHGHGDGELKSVTHSAAKASILRTSPGPPVRQLEGSQALAAHQERRRGDRQQDERRHPQVEEDGDDGRDLEGGRDVPRPPAPRRRASDDASGRTTSWGSDITTTGPFRSQHTAPGRRAAGPRSSPRWTSAPVAPPRPVVEGGRPETAPSLELSGCPGCRRPVGGARRGWVYERWAARRAGREPARLFHAALRVSLDATPYVIEVAPEWSWGRGRSVGWWPAAPWAPGCWGSRAGSGNEVRAWRDGVLPDEPYAVGGGTLVATDASRSARLPAAVHEVPTPVWGRDEPGTRRDVKLQLGGGVAAPRERSRTRRPAGRRARARLGRGAALLERQCRRVRAAHGG